MKIDLELKYLDIEWFFFLFLNVILCFRCETEKCIGVYCDFCFADAGGICPICSRVSDDSCSNFSEEM